uniref:RNA-directed DNA polymerase n=1 Tax=Tetranychus urticae TaxID=32264 RepID=A0A158P5H3_TETUR
MAVQRRRKFNVAADEPIVYEMNLETMTQTLQGWNVLVPIPCLAKRRFFECVKTHLLSVGEQLPDDDIECLPTATVTQFAVPDWMTQCRHNGITEDEIKTIIRTLGRDREAVLRITYADICSIPIPLESQRKLLEILNTLGAHINPIAQQNNQPPPLFHPSPSSTHSEPQVNPQFLLNALSNLKPDPQIIEFKKGEDVFEFITNTKQRLAQENVDDTTRLRRFKKSLAHELLAVANTLDSNITGYKEYLDALISALKTPAMQYSAQYQLRQLRYNLSEHPNTFLLKLKSSLTKAVGTYSDEVFKHELFNHLPHFIVHEINTLGLNDDITKITNLLIRKHFEAEQSKNFNKNKTNSSQPPRTSNINTYLRKPDSRNPSSNRPQPYRPPQTSNSNTITCNYCKRTGHTVQQCRTRPQNNPNYRSNHSNTPNNPNVRAITAPPSATSPANTTPSSSNSAHTLPPEPQADALRNPGLLWTLSSALTVPLLTKLGETDLCHMPQATFKLCKPTRELVREGRVLLDTGSTLSALDATVADELNAHIIPYARSLKGIAAKQYVTSQGFAYAIVKHPAMRESRVFRVHIVQNFEPVCLIGNAFIHLYYFTLKSDGDHYHTTCSEFPDSAPLDPTFYFRFCTPEETKQIFDTTTLADNTSENNYIIDTRPKQTQPVPIPVQLPESSSALMAKCEFITQEECKEIKIQPFREKIAARINPDLPQPYQEQLTDLIDSFQASFSKSKNDLGLVPASVCPVKIDLDTQEIPDQKPYNCALHRRLEFKKIINEMLANDIIEHSTAPGGSPSLLVPKPDGSFRMVIDYRKLNRITKVPKYPMPRIDDCLEVVRGGKYFNIFDLAQGYHQIELPPGEREKTVFVTPDGKYHYKRMPMGLASAPFIFQRLMNKVLDGLIYQKCVGYFDDVPVVGKDFPDLLANTKLVLNRLQDFNLKVKLEKCHFGFEEILLLGHLVSGQSIRPDPKKVEALKNLPYPRNVRELQSILGCYNYFSRYIPNFSTLAAPLYRLISKEKRFRILPEDKQALDTLKDSLISTTMLVHFDPDLRRKLSADASDHAVGGILLQEDRNSPSYDPETPIEEVKDWLPLSFYSQKLQKYQKHYSVSEKELLAIFVGVNKFTHFLEGELFLIETDHHALCQLTKVNFKNSRLQRWSIMLSTFNFKVVYKKGSTHPPDCFSRYQNSWSHRKTIDPEEEFLDRIYLIDYIADPFENRLYDIGLNSLCQDELPQLNDLNHLPDIAYSISSETHHIKTSDNPTASEISKWKEKVRTTQATNPDIQKVIDLYRSNDTIALKRYVIRDGLLYRKDINTPFGSRLVIDSQLLKDIFSYEHESPLGGHFGPEKTYLQISRRFWCQYLQDLVKQLCDNCIVCQIAKPSNIIYVDPSTKPIPKEIFERFELDVQGPSVVNQVKKYIIVLVDILSRYVVAKLTNNQTASTVISLLKSLFQTYGFPKVIQTDQGTNFTSEAVHEFLKEHGVKHEKSNPYHPQSQGIVERCNRTIAERLRSYVIANSTKDLKDTLEASLFAINSSVHKITRFSPYFLVFGRHPRKPLDNLLDFPDDNYFNVAQARKLAFARLHSQQLYQINRTKSLHKTSPYRLGDFVFVKNESVDPKLAKKFREKYHGPYLVCGLQKGSLLLLETTDLGLFSANVSNTKLYRGDLNERMKKLKEQFFNPDTYLEPENFNLPNLDSDTELTNHLDDFIDHSSDITSQNLDSDSNSDLDSNPIQNNSQESEISTNSDQSDLPLIVSKNDYNLNKFLTIPFDSQNNQTPSDSDSNLSQKTISKDISKLAKSKTNVYSKVNSNNTINQNAFPKPISQEILDSNNSDESFSDSNIDQNPSNHSNSNSSSFSDNSNYIEKEFPITAKKPKIKRKYLSADREILKQSKKLINHSNDNKRQTRAQTKRQNLGANTYVLYLCYEDKSPAKSKPEKDIKPLPVLNCNSTKLLTNQVELTNQGREKFFPSGTNVTQVKTIESFDPSLFISSLIRHLQQSSSFIIENFSKFFLLCFTFTNLTTKFLLSFISTLNSNYLNPLFLWNFKFTLTTLLSFYLSHLTQLLSPKCDFFAFANSFKNLSLVSNNSSLKGYSSLPFSQTIQQFQFNFNDSSVFIFIKPFTWPSFLHYFKTIQKSFQSFNSYSFSSTQINLKLSSSPQNFIIVQTIFNSIMQPAKKTIIERILPSGETIRVPTPHIRVDRIRSPSPIPLNKFPDSDLVPARFSDDPTVQIYVPRPPSSVTESEPSTDHRRVHRSIIIKGSSSLPSLDSGNQMLPPPPPLNKKYNKDNYDFKSNVLSEDSTDDETDAIRLSRKPRSPSTVLPETLAHQTYQEPPFNWDPENFSKVSKKGKIPMKKFVINPDAIEIKKQVEKTRHQPNPDSEYGRFRDSQRNANQNLVREERSFQDSVHLVTKKDGQMNVQKFPAGTSTMEVRRMIHDSLMGKSKTFSDEPNHSNQSNPNNAIVQISSSTRSDPNHLPNLHSKTPFKPTLVPPKINLTRTMWPNRYLKPSDYPFAKNQYPAPLPTAPLPDFVSDERFNEIKQIVKSKAQNFSVIRQDFDRFMRFKIYDHVYHDNSIKTMKLPTIPHGIVKAHIKNPEFDSIADQIQCHFCEQFALNPRECRSCQKCYCLGCIVWLRNLVEILGLLPLTHPEQFLCILPQCIKFHSQRDDYPFFKTLSNKRTLEIYNKTLFNCRRTHCTQYFPLTEFLTHEPKCRLGLFSEQFYFRFAFETTSISLKTQEELKKAPKSLANFLPTHLQTGNFDLPENHRSHDNQWYEKMNLWACLSHLKDENPNDPLLSPVAIRSLAQFSLGFWDAKKQTYDPTHPLSEGEHWIQHVIGLEPIMGKKIDLLVIKPRPHTITWSQVPFYLLTDSEEWVKVARGGIPKSNPPFTKHVAPETEDRLTPFIKINPILRLSPELQKELFEYAKHNFPSFRGFRMEHIFPSTSNTRALVNRKNKVDLATREFQHLTAINMPPLRANTEKLIKQNIKIHPSPETTFAIHMAYCRIDGWTVDGKRDALRPRPIWVVIVDGYRNIVYESLISHDDIDKMDTQYHGLRPKDIKNAKSFISVRDQILAFLLTATAIVGSGLINAMRSLDLHDDEIYALQHKFREITQHFSPYVSSPAALSLISFLLLPGFTLRAEPHSPAIEAITSMNLYMAYWQEVEESSRKWGGINHQNAVRTCGNKKVAKLLQIYQNRVRNNQARWPSNWAYVLRNNDLSFKAPCVSPASSPTSSQYSNYGSDCNVSVHSVHSSASSTSSIDSITYEYNPPAPSPPRPQDNQEFPLIDLSDDEPSSPSVRILSPHTPTGTPPLSQQSTLPASSQSIAQAISSNFSPSSSSSSAKKRRHNSAEASPDFPPPVIEFDQRSTPSSIYSAIADLLGTPSSSPTAPHSSPISYASTSGSSSTSSSTTDLTSSAERPVNYAQGKVIPYPIPPSPWRNLRAKDMPESNSSRMSQDSRNSFTSTGSSGSSTTTIYHRPIHSSQVRSHIFYPTRQRSSSRESNSSNRNQ